MSKMLLPTELDTAMSPCPFLATARGERIRDARAAGEQCETHNRLGDVGSLAEDGAHPDHDVRESTDHRDAHEESDGIPLGAVVSGAIGDDHVHKETQRHACRPEELAEHSLGHLKRIERPVVIFLLIIATLSLLGRGLLRFYGRRCVARALFRCLRP